LASECLANQLLVDRNRPGFGPFARELIVKQFSQDGNVYPGQLLVWSYKGNPDQYEKLNPAQLKRETSRLQAELIESMEKKGQQVRERAKRVQKEYRRRRAAK
jgi:hypothetical protein